MAAQKKVQSDGKAGLLSQPDNHRVLPLVGFLITQGLPDPSYKGKQECMQGLGLTRSPAFLRLPSHTSKPQGPRLLHSSQPDFSLQPPSRPRGSRTHKEPRLGVSCIVLKVPARTPSSVASDLTFTSQQCTHITGLKVGLHKNTLNQVQP